MGDPAFFQAVQEQSLIKAEIVAKYFVAWARVVMPSARQGPGKIAYLDLFAGPGSYKDGTPSTPLLVLEKAIADDDISQMLVSIFNDRDPEYVGSLQEVINGLPGIERLKHRPLVYNAKVGEELAEILEKVRLVPTLLFVDPWGYKGLTLGLLASVLKDWGCDCVFFFNYNRIRMGLRNPHVVEHVDALFGKRRADALRAGLEATPAQECELAIVNELAAALQEIGGRFVLPFRFRDQAGKRTSHHLVLVTKHVLGYSIMKEIMANYSSKVVQGVPSFEYNPADKRYPLLFELAQPLTELEGRLLVDFAGRTLTMREVCEEHHVGKPYIERNYKEALANLEAEGRITASPPAERRPKRKGQPTFADDVLVRFPPPDG